MTSAALWRLARGPVIVIIIVIIIIIIIVKC